MEKDNKYTNGIANWLNQNLDQKSLLFVSGGSTAKIAVKAINSLPKDKKSLLIITLADERFGPPKHKDSNWQLLLELGLKSDASQLIPILGSNLKTIAETTESWQSKINNILETDTKVMAIFGIGTDSHIAGLKPGSELLSSQSNVGYYTANDWQRITIAPAIFKQIDDCIVYAEGPTKKEAIDLLQKDYDWHSYPAQLIKQTKHYKIYYQV